MFQIAFLLLLMAVVAVAPLMPRYLRCHFVYSLIAPHTTSADFGGCVATLSRVEFLALPSRLFHNKP